MKRSLGLVQGSPIFLLSIPPLRQMYSRNHYFETSRVPLGRTSPLVKKPKTFLFRQRKGLGIEPLGGILPNLDYLQKKLKSM
jgi:hypothetical protein